MYVWVGPGSGQKMISIRVGWVDIKLHKIDASDILKPLVHLVNSFKVN